MPHPTQEKVRILCLVLLAAGGLACREDEPTPSDPASASLPFWALCENWKRRDGSCDQPSLLADYEDCMSSEGVPDMRRLLEHNVGSLAVRREGQRKVIVCLEKRSWRMTEAGRQNLPGRPRPAAS